MLTRALWPVLLLPVLVLGKFPDEPQPCRHGDAACIVNVINYLLQTKSGGDSSLNLIPIDPLKITKMHLHQGGQSPVNIDLNFSDSELSGFRDVHVYKVKGFGASITEQHEVHLKFKAASLRGDYKINGRILILPIQGSGKSNLTMVDGDLGVYFSGQPYEKDGETFMKVRSLKCTIEPGRLHFAFENLFNGDRALSDNMNSFLNDNWRDIYGEVRGILVEAFGKIIESIINNVFAKYPYEKYFASVGA